MSKTEIVLITITILVVGYQMFISLKNFNVKKEVRYPTAFHTVDVIAWCYYEGKKAIVLGKKKGAVKWVIPGGFVDPNDFSTEYAATRELKEETHLRVNGIVYLVLNSGKLGDLSYLGSRKVDDPRFENSPDKIITSLYTVQFEMETQVPVPGDDIETVQVIQIDELKKTYKDIMQPYHWPLIEMYFDTIK